MPYLIFSETSSEEDNITEEMFPDQIDAVFDNKYNYTSSDDSYASSFEDSSDSESLDEYGFSKDLFASEVKGGIKQTKVLDPVAERIQCLLDSQLLTRDSMYYKLIKGSSEYISWLVNRQNNHSLQFQWDAEVLQLVESLEYHGGRSVINLLRGPGHDGEGSGGIFAFDWKKWNLPLPGKTTRDKMYGGYTTEDGIQKHLLQSFLQICSQTSDIISLHEDAHVKIIPVILAKDAMALKPGLLYDSRQGKLIGSKLNLDYSYIKSGEPNKELLKENMVQEAEVSCLTTMDGKFSLQVGLNHLTKSLTAIDTLNVIKREINQLTVCLNDLKNHRVSVENGVLKELSTCTTTCKTCSDTREVCETCKGKGIKFVDPSLRPCSHCIENGKKCIKAAVICVTQDSESRNSGAQKELMTDLLGDDTQVNKVCAVPDGVHVAKRKRQSFCNWFLLVNGYRINLVQLRELRNDPLLSSTLAPLLPLSAVRNRDRQDVESILQISNKKVTAVLDKVKAVTHTVVPEKYRVTEDNKRGVLRKPIGVCRGPMGHIFVSDFEHGKVVKIRANHYPANVSVEMDSLKFPVGVAMYEDVLYCAESGRDAIAFKDLTGETVIDVQRMSVSKIKEKLSSIGEWRREDNKKNKKDLQTKLSTIVKNRQELEREAKESTVKTDQPIIQPAALCFNEKGDFFVSTFKGFVHVLHLHSNMVTIKGKVIKSIQVHCNFLYGLSTLGAKVYASAYDKEGGIFEVDFSEEKVSKVYENQGAVFERVHSLTKYSCNEIAVSDASACTVKIICPSTKEIRSVIGSGRGTRDGSAGQFSQPTGISFDGKTLFVVDTSTSSVKMVSNASALQTYLQHLELFSLTFEIHEKKEKPFHCCLDEAVERLETVYDFDNNCVKDVQLTRGSTKTTQGPQGTVSSIVLEDEKRLIDSLKHINNFLQGFDPQVRASFRIKSLLTLVVENTFAEMRSGYTDMPMQLEFDYRFSRCLKERLKRQCLTPYAYFTSPGSFYPHFKTHVQYSDLPRLHPPKAVKLTSDQIHAMRFWRVTYGQSVPQKTVRNMTTKDNPGTLPVNLYVVDPLVEPADFEQLASRNQRDTSNEKEQEFQFRQGQIVCMNVESSFTFARLLESVPVTKKKAKAVVFTGNPFNQLMYHEEDERCIPVNEIICQVEKSQRHLDTIEIDEDEFLIIQQEVIKQSDILTGNEVREAVGQDEATSDSIPVTRRSTRQRKRRLDEGFLFYDD